MSTSTLLGQIASLALFAFFFAIPYLVYELVQLILEGACQ